MKKILLILLLFLSAEIFAQTEILLRVLNSSGVGITGLHRGNIKFRYAPSYGSTDTIDITLTEIGTQGNYRATGFTTYQLTKLYINAVEQTWWGIQRTGDITTYFGALTTANTWSGVNTWTGTLSTFSGAVNATGTVVIDSAFISSSSTQYIANDPASNTAYVWKLWITSNYLDTSYLKSSGSYIVIPSGYKLKNSGNTQLFDISSQFNWSSGLNLDYIQDTLGAKKLVVNYDSTDAWENYHSKSWTLKRIGYKGYDSTYLKWYYERRLNGTYISGDNFHAINNMYEHNSPYDVQLTSSYTDMDTLTLGTVGTYQITYSVRYIFKDTVEASPPVVDSIWSICRGVSNITNSTTFVTFTYGSATDEMGMSGVISWTFLYVPSTDNEPVMLRMKYAGSGITKKFKGYSNMTAILIK